MDGITHLDMIKGKAVTSNKLMREWIADASKVDRLKFINYVILDYPEKSTVEALINLNLTQDRKSDSTTAIQPYPINHSLPTYQ